MLVAADRVGVWSTILADFGGRSLWRDEQAGTREGSAVAPGRGLTPIQEVPVPFDNIRADSVTIDARVVGRLIVAQFPRWAELPNEGVAYDGWDNRTLRLGETVSVCLPSAERYAAQVDKEYRYLPRLRSLLPLPIPVPLATGAPGEGYPWPWSVYRWLDAEPAALATSTGLRAGRIPRRAAVDRSRRGASPRLRVATLCLVMCACADARTMPPRGRRGWPVSVEATPMKRVVALVVALCSLAFAGPAVTLAQEATAAAGTFPVTPDPAECQVQPRSVEEFLAISAGATPIAAAPVAAAAEVPLGDAADAETVAGVHATARAVACFNSGDFPRAFSLLSADALRQIAAEGPMPEWAVRAFLFATPEAVPAEQRTTLLAVTDVMAMGDGRVGAFLAVTDPPSVPDTIYVIFIQEGDRWLIDDTLEFLVPGGGDEATPAP